MTEDECKNFVIQSVSHAMARDGSSGGNIRTVVINKSGIKRDYLDGSKVKNYLDYISYKDIRIHIYTYTYLIQAFWCE